MSTKKPVLPVKLTDLDPIFTMKLAIPCLILISVLLISISINGSQQFSELAKAFLHGQTNFLSSPGGIGEDPVWWHGKIYWAEGPFPAVILMPFVAFFSLFRLFFYQGYLQWVFVLGAIFFVYQIAKKLSYSCRDSLMLGLSFVLASVFIGVAALSFSWFFDQAITTFLLMWALYEFFYRKRWWLIGIIMSLVLLSRGSAFVMILFFILELWFMTKKSIWRQRLKFAAQLLLPCIVAGSILLLYNYVRFHNPFEQGYSLVLLGKPLAEARGLGLFGLVHLPGNLYSALLGAPLPVYRDSLSHVLKFPFIANNPWGMSIFLTSPYLLYLFTVKKRQLDRTSLFMIAAICASALISLTYYTSGIFQFGYRYALDFMPLLFVLFMVKYRERNKQLSGHMSWLLIVSGIFNFYLLLTVF